MDAGFKFRIGGKEYSTDELQTALDRKNITFDNWSGARKIKLGNEQFKYDEILKIVSNTIREQKEQVGCKENNNLEKLVSKLVAIKDVGHDNTSFFYTLFRRIIPNMFREGNISKLQSELENLQPESKNLVPSRQELLDYVKNNKIEIREYDILYRNKRRDIYEAAVTANCLMPKDEDLYDESKFNLCQDRIKDFDKQMKKMKPQCRKKILEIFSDKQLITYAQYLCPSNRASTHSTNINDLYTISIIVSDKSKWNDIFRDITITKKPDGMISLKGKDFLLTSSRAYKEPTLEDWLT